MPEVVDVNSDQEVKGLQTTLTVDRETAARLGITPRMIDSALNLAFGQSVVSTIYSDLNQYRVVMELAPQYWQSPEALKNIYLISPVKGQVPLSAFATYEFTNTSLAVNHQGQFAASTLSFNIPENGSLSDSVRAINDTMARIGAPASMHGSFQGTARAFQKSLESQPWLILAALITVYIVLGVLYESYVHPITILSTLPSAGVGALLALMLFDTEFSIIALIGVILLIGIVKKNAIMMIDFALETERRDGKTPGGSDLRGVPAALPADHDDDHVRAVRRAAARARHGLRRGAAAAARHLHHRRAHPEPAPHALHHPRRLRLPRPLPAVVPVEVAEDARRRDGAGGGMMRRLRQPSRSVDGIPASGAVDSAFPPVRKGTIGGTLDPRLRGDEIQLLSRQAANGPPGASRLCARRAHLSVTAILPGCKAGPDYVRPEVETPAAYRETPVHWKVARPSDDLHRGEMVGGVRRSPVERAGRAGRVSPTRTCALPKRASARRRRRSRGARSALFPTVEAQASIVRSRSPSGALGGTTAGRIVTNRSAGLEASWEPDLWGRVRRGVEASEAGAQASAADIVSARLSAQAELATSYFLIRVLDVQKKLLDDTAAAFEKTLELTQNRYAAGVAARWTSCRPKPSCGARRRRPLDLGVQRAQLEHAIALLMGKPPANFTLPPAPLRITVPEIPLGVPSELLERRSDIAAAERRVAAANAQIGVAQSAFFPSLLPVGDPGLAGLGPVAVVHHGEPLLVHRTGHRADDLRRGAAALPVRPGHRRVRRDRGRVPPDRPARLPRGRGPACGAAHPGGGSEDTGRGGARRARVGGAHDQSVQGRDRELSQRRHRAGRAAEQRAHGGRAAGPATGSRRGAHPGAGRGMGCFGAAVRGAGQAGPRNRTA